MKPYERRTLGRTGIELTLLGFGGATIGNLRRAYTDAEARAALEAAWGAGVRYIDTAPYYGVSLSERRIGDFLGEGRPGALVSTKVGRVLAPLAPGQPPFPAFVDAPPLHPRFDYTRDGVLRSFDESLRRLGRERIDVLYLHDLAPMNHGGQEPYEQHFRAFFEDGGYEAMVELRASGRAAAIGIGLGDWRAAERLIESADFDACLLAGRYTLLEQTALEGFLPLCARRGVGLVIGGPYNSGVLATGAIEGAQYNYRPPPPEVLEKVRRIERVCEAHGVALIAAALQFPLLHPSIASVIPGTATPAEVSAAVATLETPIPAGLYADLKAEGLIAADAPIG
jgi:D-threo-aldose 1-dehydrogenase